MERKYNYINERVEAQSERLNMSKAAAGHLGGVKGGPARDKALSDKKKQEIARKGATARWGR